MLAWAMPSRDGGKNEVLTRKNDSATPSHFSSEPPRFAPLVFAGFRWGHWSLLLFAGFRWLLLEVCGLADLGG
jgi:hypothetical protein